MERAGEIRPSKPQRHLHPRHNTNPGRFASHQGFIQTVQRIMVGHADGLQTQSARGVHQFRGRIFAVGSGGVIVQIGDVIQSHQDAHRFISQ